MADSDRFIVHTCVQENVAVEAVTEAGRAVMAFVPGVVVELIPEGHTHGTVTRRYIPDNDDELASLLDKYKKGTRILVTTEISSDQPAKVTRPVAPDTITIEAEPPESPPPPVNPMGNVRTVSSALATPQERDTAKVAEIAQKTE